VKKIYALSFLLGEGGGGCVFLEKTRLVKTSFKDCTVRLDFAYSLKSVCNIWCALRANKKE
jgi:hypothetical protein